jgi:HAE1 family hydrophobic/amphiphilic exporter-1
MRLILKPLLAAFEKGHNAIAKRYPNVLRWALGHKTIVIGTAFLIFIATLLIIPHLGLELIPQLSQGEFEIEFRLPPGTPLETTDAAIAFIQSNASETKTISTTFSVAGTGNRLDANPEQGGENWGELSVKMKPGSRRFEEDVTMSELRATIENLPDIQYKIFRPTLFSFKTPVEVEVLGYNLDHLKSISKDIANRMDSSPRFSDVKSTMEIGHPEIQIRFDRERVAALGLAVYEVADRVVNKIRGEVATQYSWHDRRIDVLVRAREKDRSSIDRIKKLIVNP